jgi:hypothetical protein
MERVKFRQGFKPKNVDAEAAAGELERVYHKHGALRPSDIVEEAKPKESPIHGAFEWGDKRAAHEYRLMQARTLARAVVVVSEDEKNETPYFVHVRSQQQEEGEEKSREGEYHPINIVIDNVDLFARALSELESRAHQALRSAEALKRYAEQSNDPDKMARIGLAIRALETASEAIKSLH